MIDRDTLEKCIRILTELYASTTKERDKTLLLELGYVIKQELSTVTEWERTNNNPQMINRTRGLDVNKLLADNSQLANENKILITNIEKLKEIIDNRIPKMQNDMYSINDKIIAFNKRLEEL